MGPIIISAPMKQIVQYINYSNMGLLQLNMYKTSVTTEGKWSFNLLIGDRKCAGFPGHIIFNSR